MRTGDGGVCSSVTIELQLQSQIYYKTRIGWRSPFGEASFLQRNVGRKIVSEVTIVQSLTLDQDALTTMFHAAV